MELSNKIENKVPNIGYQNPKPEFLINPKSKKEKKIISLKTGEIIYGTVNQLFCDNIAEVLLPNGTFKAFIHKLLNVGDELFFIVESVVPYLILKVHSVSVFYNNKRRSVQEICRMLDFNETNFIDELINYSSLFKNIIIREELINLLKHTRKFVKSTHFKNIDENLIKYFYWCNEFDLDFENSIEYLKIFQDHSKNIREFELDELLQKFNELSLLKKGLLFSYILDDKSKSYLLIIISKHLIKDKLMKKTILQDFQQFSTSLNNKNLSEIKYSLDHLDLNKEFDILGLINNEQGIEINLYPTSNSNLRKVSVVI